MMESHPRTKQFNLVGGHVQKPNITWIFTNIDVNNEEA
jgi:hypothetical protein